MKRRLFNILSAVSLLLCVAIVVLWVHTSRGSLFFTCHRLCRSSH